MREAVPAITPNNCIKLQILREVFAKDSKSVDSLKLKCGALKEKPDLGTGEKHRPECLRRASIGR